MATVGMQQLPSLSTHGAGAGATGGDTVSAPNFHVNSIPEIGVSAGRPSVSQSGSFGGNRFGQFSRSAFFARHNPHPVRVRHMKGLLDCPICHVNDDGYEFDKYVWRDMVSHRDLPGTSFPPNYHVENTISKNHLSTELAASHHPHHHHHYHHPDSAGNHPHSHHHHHTSHEMPHRMPVYAINLGNVHQKLNTDTIRGLQNWTGLRNYSFKERADPMLGIVPVTENWRQELRALTEAAMLAVEEKRRQESNEGEASASLKHPATWLKGGPQGGESTGMQQYSTKTGRLITPHLPRLSTNGRPLSMAGDWNRRPTNTNRDVIETRAAPLSRSGPPRLSSRGGDAGYYDPHTMASSHGGYDHIFHAHDPEVEVFSMLCGILQTDDTNAVQAWLASASEREKALVLDIVRATLLNREEYFAHEQRNALNGIQENNENIFHAGHVENDNEKAIQDNLSSQVNRLIIHADNDTNMACQGAPNQVEDFVQSMGEQYRPISPPKSPIKGSRKGTKRVSSVKGIPQPVWKPESSLVN